MLVQASMTPSNVCNEARQCFTAMHTLYWLSITFRLLHRHFTPRCELVFSSYA